MFYEDEALAGEIYVAIGMFDDPEAFEPRNTLVLPEASLAEHPG